MKLKTFVLAAVLSIFAFSGINAQVKIGYTNIEYVLAVMPEAKQVEQTLGVYQKKLAEQLQTKRQFAQQKFDQYLKDKEANKIPPAQEEQIQKELTDLDQEIQNFAMESENKLLAKREELLLPVLEKLQDKIDAVAEANGYQYILNQTTSTGVSTILFGPEENDITLDLLKALGIQVPEGGGQ